MCYLNFLSFIFQVCFAVGGYTINDQLDNITLRCTEVLHESEKWQFVLPNCLQKPHSFLSYEEDTVSVMSHCRSFPAVTCSDKLIYVIGENKFVYV